MTSRAIGALDYNGHRDLGILGRGEGDEPRVQLAVAARLRGTRLAGDLHAGDLGGLARALVHDVLHHLRDRGGGLLAERAVERLAVARVAQRPARGAHAVDQRRLHDDAAVADRRGDHRHLHRRDDQVGLADGRARRIDRRVRREQRVRARAHGAGRRELVGRIIERRDGVEAQLLQRAREHRAARAPAADLAAEPREHAVDGVRERVREVERARETLAVVIGDPPAVLLEVARIVELRLGVGPAALERQGRDHRLDRRARRVEALRGAIDEGAARARQRARHGAVGVEARPGRAHEHAPRAWLDGEHGAGAAGSSESCTSSPWISPPASECSWFSSAPPRSVWAPIR